MKVAHEFRFVLDLDATCRRLLSASLRIGEVAEMSPLLPESYGLTATIATP